MSPIELIDLAVASIVLYFTLRWLAASTSRRAMLALGIAIAVYATSRAAGLFLTERLLRLGGGVLAVALLVAFQEDVRRGFERLAVWTRGERDPLDAVRSTLDCLVEVCDRLAERKTGALIVLPGRQSLESHVRGGVDLRGVVSVPLLCSIFSTDSPGHDGAALLDGTRVRKFGAHLPLSRNLGHLGERGTRHAAGLGLSERTDALVLIVSEEQGTISVAENGRLEHVPGGGRLRARLESHYEYLGLLPVHPPVRHWLPAHIGAKALAVGLVVGWWALTPPLTTVHRVFRAPIQYVNLPSDSVLAEPHVSQADVTLAGPERAFAMVTPDALRLSIDLGQLPNAVLSAPLTARELSGHGSLDVVGIDPGTVPVATVKLQLVELPVRVRLRGEPRPGLRFIGAEPQPSTVRLLVTPDVGAAQIVDTEPVDVSMLAESQIVTLPLVLPAGARWPDGKPGAVLVRVVVRPA